MQLFAFLSAYCIGRIRLGGGRRFTRFKSRPSVNECAATWESALSLLHWWPVTLTTLTRTTSRRDPPPIRALYINRAAQIVSPSRRRVILAPIGWKRYFYKNHLMPLLTYSSWRVKKSFQIVSENEESSEQVDIRPQNCNGNNQQQQENISLSDLPTISKPVGHQTQFTSKTSL